jgi:hypothetical protein
MSSARKRGGKRGIEAAIDASYAEHFLSESPKNMTTRPKIILEDLIASIIAASCVLRATADELENALRLSPSPAASATKRRGSKRKRNSVDGVE